MSPLSALPAAANQLSSIFSGGLTHATSGRVTIDGADFAQLSDAQRTEMRKQKIGFVFQKFNLLPTLSAKGNIEIASEIAGKNGLDKKLVRPGHADAGHCRAA